MGRLSLLTGFCLFLASCTGPFSNTPSSEPPSDFKPHLEAVECWFETSKLTPRHSCYNMHVPENYQKPKGRWITFPVAYFYASDAQPHPSPVLHLGGGGPGAAMISGSYVPIDTVLKSYSPLALDRKADLVIIDPRGSGASEPQLVCNEFQKAFPDIIQIADSGLQLKTAYATSAACYQRLIKQHVDPDQYNSGNVARDVDALRQTLNISRWDLYGISYGSRYALTLIRDFPETVRSAVLDSPVFSGINYGERSAVDLYQAFEKVFSRCKAKSSCHTAHPESEFRFWELVDALNKKPLSLTGVNPLTEDELPYKLTGDTLVTIAFINLYDEQFMDALPTLIDDLSKGNAKALDPYTERWIFFMMDDSFSDGSYNSHLCADEHPYVNYQNLADSYKTVHPTLSDMLTRTHEESERFCHNIWPVKASGDPYITEAIKSDIPVLLLQGALDPAVNASYLEKQLKNFTTAIWKIFPDAAHDTVSADPCAGITAGWFYDAGLRGDKMPDCK